MEKHSERLGDFPKATQLVASKWQSPDVSPGRLAQVCAFSYYKKPSGDLGRWGEELWYSKVWPIQGEETGLFPAPQA